MRALLVISLTTALGFIILALPVCAYDNYAAIAYSESTGAWGSGYNFSSRAAAEMSAMSRCGRGDCEIKVWFVNACGALAVGQDGALGWGWADSRAEAENIALAECHSRGSGCGIRCWACTDR